MSNAVIYARVSSDRQKVDKTIESQIAELKKHVTKNGDTVVKEYVDNGHSGALLDRPAMNQLREDLKTNIFDSIYFLNSDRIARDVSYQNIMIGEMLWYKKQIIINGQNYEHNPENKFTLTVLGAVNELERAKIIERSMRGRKHWLKQGMLMSNGAGVYGYEYHRRTAKSYPSYTLNKQEAEVIREIFELYAKGDIGCEEVAVYLKKKKAHRRPKSKPWNKNHVRYIIRNIMYTGIRYFDMMTFDDERRDPMQKSKRRKMVIRDRRDWIGIKVPAIISQELYDKVQERIKYNMRLYRNSQRKQLLSGLLFCEICGTSCYSVFQHYWVKRVRTGKHLYEKTLYYHHRVGNCDTKQNDVRIIDGCVLKVIKEMMLDPKKLRECIPSLKKHTNNHRTEKQVKDLEQKVRDITQKKNRLVDLYASGDLEREAYLKRKSQYDSDIETMKSKQGELQKRVPLLHTPQAIGDAVEKYCAQATDRFTQCANFDTKRRFLMDFISRVSYRNDRVSVHGSVPIGDEKLGFIIRQKINRDELMQQLLALDRKTGIVGSPISRSNYWDMADENAKILKQKSL